MKKLWKRFVTKLMDMDAEHMMKKVNRDPEVKDAEAPDELYDKILAQIHEYEEKQAEEEEELIRLGRIYKKNKKRNKILVILAAAIGILALGMTSMGGPKRVYEQFKRTIGGREQSYTNTDDDRTAEVGVVSEADAYEQIDNEFGFYPVRLDYLPDKMIFTEAVIEKDTQNIRLYYEKGEEKVLNYIMWTNYRTVSTGADVEDSIVDEHTKTVQDVDVLVKKILVEENQEIRWRAEFQYQEVQYFIMMHGFTEEEMKQTIENLYFVK